MKRLFIAIPLKLNNIAKKTILELQKQLSRDNIKWVALDSTHLTLVFLGDTDEGLIPSIVEILNNIQYDFFEYQVKLTGLYTFGSGDKPNVLWTKWIDQNETKKIALNLIEEISSINFNIKSTQKFIPHLTLGRIKKIVDIDNFNKIISEHSDFFLGNYVIEEIVLFESKLTSRGPNYFPIHKIKAKK